MSILKGEMTMLSLLSNLKRNAYFCIEVFSLVVETINPLREISLVSNIVGKAVA